MTAVEVKGVEKTYNLGKARVHALRGVDIAVSEGEFVTIAGPSGSGKSTLLNIIGCIDSPNRGEVWIGRTEVSRLSEKKLDGLRLRTIGFVFQSFNLIPVLTAFENVEMPLLLTSLSKRERAEHVRTVLEVVGLGDRMTHYPRQLSGGQEQRVAIARALVTDPDLILADEPTGDLDAHSAQDVLEILRKLNRDFGKTIVLVTHDPRGSQFGTVTRHLEKGELLPLNPSKTTL